jgi:hypothetical protein
VRPIDGDAIADRLAACALAVELQRHEHLGGARMVQVGEHLVGVDADGMRAIGAGQKAAQRDVERGARPALEVAGRRGPHASGVGPHELALGAAAHDARCRRRDIDGDDCPAKLDEDRLARRARRPA